MLNKTPNVVAKAGVKRAKLTSGQRSRLSTQNEERSRRVTRSMEKDKSRGAGSSRRRKSDPGGTKRKLISDEDEEVEEKTLGDAFSEIGTSLAFDLFSFGEEKKDWDEHPEMEKLMTLGRKKMEQVGFSSPREGMGNITIHSLAKDHNVKLPKKRKQSVEVLVRALAIEKLKAESSTSSKYYEDKKTATK